MGYTVFVNSESNKNIKEVKEELEKIRKNIEYVLFLLGDDASYNIDIGCKLTHIKIVSFCKKFAVLLSNTTLFVLARLQSSYTVRHQY